MNAFTALARGNARVSRTRRVQFLLWFFYLLLALITAVQVPVFLQHKVSLSLWADDLVKELDAQWLFEAWRYFHAQPVAAVGFAFVLTALLAVLAQTFFAGGAIRLYTAEETCYRSKDFFHDCAFYFWRCFRLLLFAAICYGLVLAFSGALGKIADKIWGEGMEARPLFYFGRVQKIVTVLLLVYVNASMDFAKVRMVSENSGSAVSAGMWGLRFTARYFLRVLILFAIAALLVVALFAIYRAGEEWLPRTMGGALLLLLVGQAVSLARIRLRLTVWAAEAQIYNSLNPPYRPPEEVALVGAYVAPAPPDLSASAQAEPPPADEEV